MDRAIIGLLEDDPDMADLVSLWLGEAGYTVRWYRDAGEFRRGQGRDSVDLLLLDWMLPDTPGIEVLSRIRAGGGTRLPVIFVTALDSEEDIVRGLAAGADDYVTKPPRQRELLARIGSALRRHAAEGGGNVLELAPYQVDGERRRIRLEGSEVGLTDREFELANFLFRRHGRLVSRDALLTNVWNISTAVTTRTVDTHVSRLRRKLALDGSHGWRLAAVYQHGYRLEQV